MYLQDRLTCLLTVARLSVFPETLSQSSIIPSVAFLRPTYHRFGRMYLENLQKQVQYKNIWVRHEYKSKFRCNGGSSVYKMPWWFHMMVMWIEFECIPSSKSISGWRMASAAWITSAFEIAWPWPPPFTSQRSFPVAITETSTLRWKLENILKCCYIWMKNVFSFFLKTKNYWKFLPGPEYFGKLV